MDNKERFDRKVPKAIPGLGIVEGWGTDAPPAGVGGWARGGIYSRFLGDGHTGQPGQYLNIGSQAASDFVSAGASDSIVVAASDAPTPAKARADYVCDGADDQVEINAALATLASSGGRVVCSAGTYSITAPILVPSRTELIFAHGNSLTVPAAHGFDTPAHQYRVYEADAMLWSAIIRNANGGLGGDGDTGIVVRGLRLDAGEGKGDDPIYGSSGHIGIHLDNVTDCLIEDCHVEGVAYNQGGHAYGICVSNAQRVMVERSRASECGYEGFAVRGTTSYVTLRSCSGEDNVTHLAQLARWSGLSLAGDGHHDVLFEDLHSSGAGVDNVIFHGREEAPITNSSIQRCRIEDGLVLMGNVHACSVVGNVAKVISLKANDDSESIANVLIANNLCSGEDGAAVEPGIRLDIEADGASISNIMLQGNVLRFGYLGLTTADDTDGTISNVTLQGNMLLGKSGGLRYPFTIRLGGDGDVTNIILVGNHLQTQTEETGSACVRVDLLAGSTGSVDNIHILNSFLKSQNGFSLYTASGSGTVSRVHLIGNVLDCNSNPIYTTSNKLSKVLLLNNVIADAASCLNGPMNDVIFHGNVLSDITGFETGSPTNVAYGMNPSWEAGGEDGAWRLAQDGGDADQMHIQKLISGTWTTADTFDASL